MRIRLEDLPDEYRRQAEMQLGDTSSVRPAKQERNGEKALDAPLQVQKMVSPVIVKITVHKVGDGWDVDNREVKGLLDSLRSIGILEDDSIKHIPKIIKEGIRCKKKTDEKTIVEIYEC